MMADSIAALNCAGGSPYLFPVNELPLGKLKADALELSSPASLAAPPLAEARSQSSSKSVQSSEDVATREHIPK